MRGRGDRLEALLAERELDRMLVTDLTNVRYLTGFTGTNGACVCGPGVRLFLTDFRYTERAAAEVEGWETVTIADDWLGGIAERLERPGRLRGRPHVGPRAGETEEKLRRRASSWSPPAARSRSCGGSRTRTSWRRSPRPRSSPTRSGAGALERGLAGRTEREVARAAEARIRELGGEPVLPGDRRRRPQRRPAARRARRARDRPRRAGRLRHGGQARRLLLRRHPHLRHRRARRGGRARSTRSCCEAQQAALEAIARRASRARTSTRSPAR